MARLQVSTPLSQDDRDEHTPLLPESSLPGGNNVNLQGNDSDLYDYHYETLLPGRYTPVNVSLEQKEPPEIRTYWWRWVVLIVFCLNFAMNNIFWITASPIADVMKCYYQVNDFWVNSLSSVYMPVYIILAFPCAWMMDKYGIRVMVVLASCSNVLGAGLRIAGSGAKFGFWLLLSGQGVVSLCNVLIWGAAPLLSETWFPVNERATATALSGAVAPTAGLLIGSALSPFLVRRSDTDEVCGNATAPPTSSQELFDDWSETIYNQLFYYLVGQGGLALIILILTLVAFPNVPPSPPSLSRQMEASKHRDDDDTSGLQQVKEFVVSILKSLTNIYFVFIVITGGIMVGAFGTILTVINEMVTPYFDGYDEQISYIGITIQISAFIAMVIVGRILDFTKAFYALNVILSVSATAAVALLAALIQYQKHFYLLYIAAGLIGATLAAFPAVMYEYAVEMTYPLPEGTSAGLVIIATQIVNFAMIEYSGPLLQSEKLRPFGIWALAGVVAIAAILALFTRPKLRRLEIDRGTISNDKQ